MQKFIRQKKSCTFIKKKVYNVQSSNFAVVPILDGLAIKSIINSVYDKSEVMIVRDEILSVQYILIFQYI